MRRFFVVGALVLALAMSLEALSQSSNANVSGTVSDAAKALIPGVTVTREHGDRRRFNRNHE